MYMNEKTPRWCKLPDRSYCRICGRDIYEYDEYEVVKPNGRRPTMFLHAECVEKDNKEMKEARGL